MALEKQELGFDAGSYLRTLDVALSSESLKSYLDLYPKDRVTIADDRYEVRLNDNPDQFFDGLQFSVDSDRPARGFYFAYKRGRIGVAPSTSINIRVYFASHITDLSQIDPLVEFSLDLAEHSVDHLLDQIKTKVTHQLNLIQSMGETSTRFGLLKYLAKEVSVEDLEQLLNDTLVGNPYKGKPWSKVYSPIEGEEGFYPHVELQFSVNKEAGIPISVEIWVNTYDFEGWKVDYQTFDIQHVKTNPYRAFEKVITDLMAKEVSNGCS